MGSLKKTILLFKLKELVNMVKLTYLSNYLSASSTTAERQCSVLTKILSNRKRSKEQSAVEDCLIITANLDQKRGK